MNNNRIQQIADKIWAEQYWTGPDTDRLLPAQLNRFAQLIVNECVDICNQIYFDRYPEADDFERSEEGDAILQHFGIKL